MARSAITRTAFPLAGFNITDATYTTMATGANNGVTAPSQQGDVLILRNDTGGAAAYTIKTPQATGYAAQGITVSDVVVTVAAAKIWVYEPTTLQRQADNQIYVDCDVAGKILLLAMN
jgi:hypothetical protein